jgi:hypothetical protein
MPDQMISIDAKNGFIHLPNGGVIVPDLTLDVFEKDSAFLENRSIASGVPWWRYAFSAGHIDGKGLLVSIQFYDQMLLYVDMTVNHYPPSQQVPSEEIEAAAKRFHDSLLERMMGTPAKTADSQSSYPDKHPELNRTLKWIFPWGTVASLFIGQSCSALIMVRYGNRYEEAHTIDRQRRLKS